MNNTQKATNQVSLWSQKIWVGNATEIMTIEDSRRALTAVYVVDMAIKRMMGDGE